MLCRLLRGLDAASWDVAIPFFFLLPLGGIGVGFSGERVGYGFYDMLLASGVAEVFR